MQSTFEHVHSFKSYINAYYYNYKNIVDKFNFNIDMFAHFDPG